MESLNEKSMVESLESIAKSLATNFDNGKDDKNIAFSLSNDTTKVTLVKNEKTASLIVIDSDVTKCYQLFVD